MVTVMPFCIRLGQGWMVIVLLDVVILGLGRAVQDDGRFLCFPSPKVDKYSICFDVSDSTYLYLPSDELPVKPEVTVKNGYLGKILELNEPFTAFRMEVDQHNRDVPKVDDDIRSFLHKLIHQVAVVKHKRESKRAHGLSKRPFDSISYGGYFGGFGKK